MAQNVQDLIVWQRSVELTVCIYKLTRSFCKDEVYGLTSQMRRASVSVASNIAEGRGRLNPAEFCQFSEWHRDRSSNLKPNLLSRGDSGWEKSTRSTKRILLVNKYPRFLDRSSKSFTQQQED